MANRLQKILLAIILAIVLLDVRPSQASVNCANSASGDSLHFSDRVRRQSDASQFSDFANIVVSQFGHAALLPSDLPARTKPAIASFQSHSDSMVVVLPPRDPFEIRRPVMRFIAVNVVTFRSSGANAFEGDDNKSVNEPLALFAILVQPNVMITSGINADFKQEAVCKATLTKAGDSAKITDFIPPLVSDNRHPYFKVLCGNARMVDSHTLKYPFSLWLGPSERVIALVARPYSTPSAFGDQPSPAFVRPMKEVVYVEYR